jgi:hypothetical protein
MRQVYTFTLFGVDGTETKGECLLPNPPGYINLSKVMKPLLDGAELEHVSVLHLHKPHDMFVDELGSIHGLPVNRKATEIYHENTRINDPGRYEREKYTMPKIHGPAVLFHSKVWF